LFHTPTPKYTLNVAADLLVARDPVSLNFVLIDDFRLEALLPFFREKDWIISERSLLTFRLSCIRFSRGDKTGLDLQEIGTNEFNRELQIHLYKVRQEVSLEQRRPNW
jgi:hypothetical protein